MLVPGEADVRLDPADRRGALLVSEGDDPLGAAVIAVDQEGLAGSSGRQAARKTAETLAARGVEGIRQDGTDDE